MYFFFLESKTSKADDSVDETCKEGGESYFVSDKMYSSMNVCRCGRKKEGTHLIKCLQKSVIKYSDGQVSTGSTPTGDKEEQKPNIPRTSNEIFGFFRLKYLLFMSPLRRLLSTNLLIISTKAVLLGNFQDIESSFP